MHENARRRFCHTSVRTVNPCGAFVTATPWLIHTFCVAGGWIGGEFFPMIFCGVSAGYALALATGCDPMIAVACTTAALVSACTRKPMLTIVVLALCFPPTTLPLVAVCAALAAKAPGLRR